MTLCCATLLALACGCGRRAALERFERPSEVRNFEQLFAQNCSGCHGAEGKFGPAPPLNDPLFLAIIPEAEFTRVVSAGRSETLMPAFAPVAERWTTSRLPSWCAVCDRNGERGRRRRRNAA